MSGGPTGGSSATLLAPEALDDRPARQARATLRDAVVADYAEQMRDGATFPAIIAFTDDGARFWLADGRHRLEAHRRARPGEPIACEVRPGDELAALRFALAANGHHGARRSGDDLRAAFSAAVAAALVDPPDAGAVAALLGCSTATAYRLTEAARAEKRERFEERVTALSNEGRTQGEIARELGVDQATVSRRAMQNSREKNASPPPAPGQPASSRENHVVPDDPKPVVVSAKRADPPEVNCREPVNRPGHVPVPAGAMELLDRISKTVSALGPLDAQRVAAGLPLNERPRYRRVAGDLHRWSGALVAALHAGTSPTTTDCPRCDGEGSCGWCRA